MDEYGFKEILNAFKLHSEHIDKKMDTLKADLTGQINGLGTRVDGLDNRMDEGFKRVDKKLDNLNKKLVGLRVELTETQETVDYLSSKNVQHEKKLRSVYRQQA
ncbi:hypothetical protein [Lentibacillus sp. Marseille-P4043]|uniref:hypothetical protein n=1 Tax=Lentibacillus sp. Marseille-P4043 TaxID=2040293 RepID=UPI000D0AC9FB|nr:hypothetical protein [Lentibacillus sp. Marseille-P4043]